VSQLQLSWPVERPWTPRRTTLWISDGIAWRFNQSKCWSWWQTVMCGSLILSCCPPQP